MLLLDGTEDYPTPLERFSVCSKGDYMSVRSKGILHVGQFDSFHNGSIYFLGTDGRTYFIARWKGSTVHLINPTQEQSS